MESITGWTQADNSRAGRAAKDLPYPINSLGALPQNTTQYHPRQGLGLAELAPGGAAISLPAAQDAQNTKGITR